MYKSLIFVAVGFILGGAGSVALAKTDVPKLIQEVFVQNWPESMDVTVANENPVPVSGEVNVTANSALPVSFDAEALNLSGNVSVDNFPETQNVNITNSEPIPVTMSGNGAARWEYESLCDIGEDTMDNLGGQGWQLVTTYNADAVTCHERFIFIRPL